VDGDGDLDLFVARYVEELDPDRILDGTLTGAGNALYLNEDGAWRRDEGALPDEVIDDLTFMGQWLDADGDGDLDLYLANDFGPHLGRNRLLLNDGTGQFTVDDTCDCDLAMFAMGAAVGDANDDGHPDLFLTDLAGPDLLLSVGDGSYYEASMATGATVPVAEDHLASWGTAFVDLDRDGHEDLPMVFGPLFPHGDPDGLAVLGEEYAAWIDGPAQRDVLLAATGDGFFEDVSTAVGFVHDGMGRALAVGDLDRDGRPDLMTAGLWYARAWRTSGGCDGGIAVRFPAQGPSIGARVEAEVGDRTLVRWLAPAGTWSSSAHEVILGLGSETRAAEVRVIMADGALTSWQDVEAGETLVVPMR
jgi:hypothetical protein